MLRQSGLLSRQRAYFHRQYQFVDSVLASDQTVTSQCECYSKEVNSNIGQDKQLDINIEIPKKIPEYKKHVLVVSPRDRSVEDIEWKSSWQSKLELNPRWPYSIIGSLKEHLKHSNAGSGILVNAISLISGEFAPLEPSDEQVASIFVLPDMKLYRVSRGEISDFAHFLGGGVSEESRNKHLNFYDFLKGANNAQVNPKPSHSESVKPQFDHEVLEKDWLLICGHLQRDERCGIIAEDCLKEIRTKGLCADRNIAVISHIGGHKYAGNIILYNHEKSSDDSKKLIDCLWFSKVLPPTLPILLENLEKGKIPKELFRGGVSMN